MPPDDFHLGRTTAASGDDDDNADYELEPPDAEVLAAEERRAAAQVDAVKRQIDIDDLYRDLEDNRDAEIIRSWVENLRFRFQVKHLLILTAVVAVLLAIARAGGGGIINAIVVSFMLAVIGLTLYLQWHERKRVAEADRRRERIYAERRAAIQGAIFAPTNSPPRPAPASRPQRAEEPAPEPNRPSLQFQFTPRQIALCVICAVASLALIIVAGGPHSAAMVCGIVALLGIIINALGYEPPEVVAFVWWVILLLYIVLSIFSAIWAGFAGP